MFLDQEERVVNPRNYKTPPPPMWGEVLEEDLYDDNTPFYNHEEAQYELEKRKAKVRLMLEQDQKIRDAI